LFPYLFKGQFTGF